MDNIKGYSSYSADYIEDNKDDEQRAFLIELIQSAVKFRMPENGLMIGLDDNEVKDGITLRKVLDVLGGYIDKLQLPYKEIVFEFMYNQAKMLVMARDNGNGTINFLYSFNTLIDDDYEWVDTRANLAITPDLDIKSYTGDDTIQITKSEERLYAYIGCVILSFIAAMQCSNVTVAEVSAPTTLSNSRIKKGKLPLFDYKIPTLDINQGLDAGKKAVLERGNIRRLDETRTIWVMSSVYCDNDDNKAGTDYRLMQ